MRHVHRGLHSLISCVLCICLFFPVSLACAKGKEKSTKPMVALSPQMKEQVTAYADIFAQEVRANWQLPPRADRRKLKAVVIVEVAKDGRISKTTLSEPSGDRLFDSTLLNALKHVGQLPPLPEIKGSPLQLFLNHSHYFQTPNSNFRNAACPQYFLSHLLPCRLLLGTYTHEGAALFGRFIS